MNLAILEPTPPLQGPPFPQFLRAHLPYNGLWPWYANPETAGITLNPGLIGKFTLNVQ